LTRPTIPPIPPHCPACDAGWPSRLEAVSRPRRRPRDEGESFVLSLALLAAQRSSCRSLCSPLSVHLVRSARRSAYILYALLAAQRTSCTLCSPLSVHLVRSARRSACRSLCSPLSCDRDAGWSSPRRLCGAHGRSPAYDPSRKHPTASTLGLRGVLRLQRHSRVPHSVQRLSLCHGCTVRSESPHHGGGEGLN
jgi:hypothetical protein